MTDLHTHATLRLMEVGRLPQLPEDDPRFHAVRELVKRRISALVWGCAPEIAQSLLDEAYRVAGRRVPE